MSLSRVAKPFTEGLAQGEIRYQRCQDCGTAQRLARYACTHCGGTQLDWAKAQGSGRIFAITEVRRAPTDEFKALVPYSLAMVDLEEGARVMGHAQAGLQVGQSVKISVFTLGTQPLIRVQAG